MLRKGLCNRRWERDLPDTCPRLWWTNYGVALPDSDDVRKGVRVFRATLRAVLRRPWQVLAIWIPLALCLGAVTTLYLGFRSLLPAGSGLVLAIFLAQQLVMIARAGMRVALWSGEIALVERTWAAAPLTTRLAAAPSVAVRPAA